MFCHLTLRETIIKVRLHFLSLDVCECVYSYYNYIPKVFPIWFYPIHLPILIMRLLLNHDAVMQFPVPCLHFHLHHISKLLLFSFAILILSSTSHLVLLIYNIIHFLNYLCALLIPNIVHMLQNPTKMCSLCFSCISHVVVFR